MTFRSTDKPTTWMKFECSGGARWTSTTQDYADEVCTFSGCNCGTKVRKVGTTTSRDEASAWFKRPLHDWVLHPPFLQSSTHPKGERHMAKLVQIPTNKINVDKQWPIGGEYDSNARDNKGYWEKATLKVGNLNYAGFGLGFVPEGYEARQVDQGPMVPGPWAYAYGHASVLCDSGGTKSELERAEADKLLYHADLGDILELDGVLFKIEKTHNRNIKLVNVADYVEDYVWNTELEARVLAVNNANREAMRLYPILRAIFEPLVGQKLLKADGSFLAKIAKQLPIFSKTPKLSVYWHRESLAWGVKACQTYMDPSWNEGTMATYYEAQVNVGFLRQGILESIHDPEELRTDYTVEGVKQARKSYEIIKKAANDAYSALAPFGE